MKHLNQGISRLFPAKDWLSRYQFSSFKSDLIAALIVLAMLVPQGMAYAMLAGLPPIMGIYAIVNFK